MSGISTHILDTTLGKPAVGVQVTLDRFGAEAGGIFTPAALWKTVGQSLTDADGRIRPLLPADRVKPGIYRLTFVTGPYFKQLGQTTLYPEITITFSVLPDQPNYHIPLLLNAYGYTTYRGT